MINRCIDSKYIAFVSHSEKTEADKAPDPN
jgi:hypothetical protein